MNHFAIGIIAMLSASFTVSAQDILYRTILNNKQLWNKEILEKASSLREMKPDSSLSALYFACDDEIQTFYHHPEEGSHVKTISLNAILNTPLPDGRLMGGQASYAAKTNYGKRYNLASDYEMIHPYTISGDGMPYDTEKEEYSFSGYYLSVLRNFVLSYTAKYKASKEIRLQDPRPLNISDFFTAGTGFSYKTISHRMGLHAECTFYHQSGDVSYFHKKGSLFTFNRTGLDYTSMRFLGSWNTAKYQGRLYDISFFAEPVNTGFSCGYSYSAYHAEKRLVNGNYLPLNEIKEHFHKCRAGYEYNRFISSEGIFAGTSLEISIKTRKGEENLFGKAASTSYDIIGKRENFTSKNIAFLYDAHIGLRNSRSLTSLGLSYEIMNIRRNMQDNGSRLSELHRIAGVDFTRMDKIKEKFTVSEFLTLKVHPADDFILILSNDIKDKDYKPFFDGLQSYLKESAESRNSYSRFFSAGMEFSGYMRNTGISLLIRYCNYLNNKQLHGYETSLKINF